MLSTNPLKNLKFYWFLLGLFYVLMLQMAGIRWGLPDQARQELVLSPSLRTEAVFREMTEAREALFEDSESIFASQDLLQKAQDNNLQNTASNIFEWNATNRSFYLSLARSYLLRTFEPDISNIMNAFSNLDPARFDFFPNTFSYGLVFLGFYGVILKVLAVFGILTLKSYLPFYLQHPEAMGQIYLALRLISCSVNFAAAFVMFRLASLFLSRGLAATASLLYLSLPITLNQGYVVKPHTLGGFFILLSIYYLVKGLNLDFRAHGRAPLQSQGDKTQTAEVDAVAQLNASEKNSYNAFEKNILNVRRGARPCAQDLPTSEAWSVDGLRTVKKYFLFASFCAGLAFGCVPTNGIFALLLAAVGILYLKKSNTALFSRESVSIFMALSIPFLILAACSGFSILLRIETFLEEYGKQNRFYQIPPLGEALKQFILELNRNFGLPLFITGLAGILTWKGWRSFWIFAIALMFLLYLKLNAYQMGLRFILPLVPIWIIAAFVAIAKLRGKKGFVVLLFLYPVLAGSSEAFHFRADSSAQATRLQAGRWINEHLPKQAIVGLEKIPVSFNSPPFSYENFRLVFDNRGKGFPVAPDYVIVTGRERLSFLWQGKQNYTEVSHFENKAPAFLTLLPRFYPIANPEIFIFEKKREG